MIICLWHASCTDLYTRGHLSDLDVMVLGLLVKVSLCVCIPFQPSFCLPSRIRVTVLHSVVVCVYSLAQELCQTLPDSPTNPAAGKSVLKVSSSDGESQSKCIDQPNILLP